MIKHLWFWLVITLIAVFIMPVIVSSETYQLRIKNDLAVLEHAFGSKSANQIMEMSDKTYAAVFEETGFRDWVMSHYYIDSSEIAKQAEQGGEPTGLAGKLSQNYAVSLFMNLYELTFRMVQMFIWMLYSFPFVLAALWDGAMQRKVKIVSFSYSSPSIYNASWHFLIALIFCGFCYFNTPLPVPPITFPIVVGVMAIALRNLVSNLQRSA